VFIELAIGIMTAIKTKGYSNCQYSNNFLDGYRHIIFGANAMCKNNLVVATIPCDSIIVNCEQLSDDSPWVNNIYMNILKKHLVWDYSKDNIAWLNKHDIIFNVSYLPIGNFSLGRDPVPEEQDIDVLFYGYLNHRRQEIYQQLKKNLDGKNIMFEENIWGDERDKLICRSKIILNIHYYETKIFEIIRISHLLANQAFVISEDSTATSTYANLKDGYVECAYSEIVNKVTYYLDNPNERKKIAKKGYDLIKLTPQTVPLESIS